MFFDIFFIMLLAVLAVMIGLGFLADRWLRKKLNVPKREGALYKPVHPFQVWIEALIVIGSIIILFNIEFEVFRPGALVPFVFFLLFSFRTFMEWKFDRERKEYIITALSSGILLVFWVVIVIFDYFI